MPTPEYNAWVKDTFGVDPAAFAVRTDKEAALAGGIGAAAGRDTEVGAQVRKLGDIARAQPETDFSGDVYRAVDSKYADTYADHSFSQGGRYNAAGQSALYTAKSLADLQAEAKNYPVTDAKGNVVDPTGLRGKSVIRSEFNGKLLDATQLPGVDPKALTEPYGKGGAGKSILNRVTGEDPYTMPRVVADAARARDLSGVMAPANEGNVNIPLFPENPATAPKTGGALHDGLAYKGQQDVVGGALQPEHVSPTIRPNIDDITPNRNAALAAEDSAAHGRAGGARYGAAGAAAVSLAMDAYEGHFNKDDAENLAVNTGEGALLGQADSMLARGLQKAATALSDIPVGGIAAETEKGAVGTAAGMASAGVIGAVVGGGIAAWNDSDKVRDGSMKAGDATADVVVGAGVGLGAGLAGAAAGAAIGSIVPIAGTAVGAVLGFGAGMIASVATTVLAEKSGVAGEARRELGEYLDKNFEKPLEDVWHGAQGVADDVRGAAHKVVDAGGAALHAVGEKLDAGVAAAKAELGEIADAGQALAHAGGEAVDAVGQEARKAEAAAEAKARALAEAAAAQAQALKAAAAKKAEALKEAAEHKIQEAEAAARKAAEEGTKLAQEAEQAVERKAHEVAEAAEKAKDDAVAAAKRVADEAAKAVTAAENKAGELKDEALAKLKSWL